MEVYHERNKKNTEGNKRLRHSKPPECISSGFSARVMSRCSIHSFCSMISVQVKFFPLIFMRFLSYASFSVQSVLSRCSFTRTSLRQLLILLVLISQSINVLHLFCISATLFMNDQWWQDIQTNPFGLYRFDQHE
jgi:hypothetical protein